MQLTEYEAQQIAANIGPVFDQYLNQYDFRKYPPTDYARFKVVYATRDAINNEIRGSLVWKWGHVGKANFPLSQQTLISKIEALWLAYVVEGKEFQAEFTFNWWSAVLPDTAYITAAYVTHLVHHADPLPIIDQHNFRAMNDLIKAVRPDHKGKMLPRNWTDISDLQAFMSAILKYLPKDLSFGDLDRFLMMYGRSIKVRKPRKSGIRG